MSIGWLIIHRELMDKPIWKGSTPEQKVVLMTLLMMVDFKPSEWEWNGEKYTTKPGEKITSLQSIVTLAGKGISIQNVRSSLKRFEKLEFLTNKPTKQGRLISIINWDSYQSTQQGTQQGDQQRPNKGPTPNEQGNKETRKQKNEIEYPEWLNRELFDEFIQDRKDRKCPATPRAIKGLITALDKACNGNHYLQNQIIEKAISNSWKSFFALKDYEIAPDPTQEEGYMSPQQIHDNIKWDVIANLKSGRE